MTRLGLFALSILLSANIWAEPVHVYFGTDSEESHGIYRATLDATSGELGDAIAVAEIGSPEFLAFDASNEFLYAVANNGEPVVAAYRVAESGDLAQLNSEPIGDGRAAHIAVHPSGKFLLTAQYFQGSVAVFPILDDGSIGERSQIIKHAGSSGIVPSRQSQPRPHWVGYSPDGKFAFVPDLGSDKIVIYKIDVAEPSIAYHGYAESVPGGGPRHMRFSVDGNYIYLLNELAVSVSTFAWNSEEGTAHRLNTTAALSEDIKAREVYNSSSEIVVHPNGQFVYSANRGNDSVTVFHATPETAELSVREVEPVRGAWPRNINLDPSGKWLLVAAQHSNTVSVFAVDPVDGELTFQRNNIINVPAPMCIVFQE